MCRDVSLGLAGQLLAITAMLDGSARRSSADDGHERELYRRVVRAPRSRAKLRERQAESVREPPKRPACDIL
jgi:hypothetical protein